MTSSFFNVTASIPHDHDSMPHAFAFIHALATETRRLIAGDETPAMNAHWALQDAGWEFEGHRGAWVTCELFTETWVNAPSFSGEKSRLVQALRHTQRISVVFGKDGQPTVKTSGGEQLLTVQEIAEAISKKRAIETW